MIAVIDASFVASLFLPDEAGNQSAPLAARIAADEAAAPSLLQLEFTNILLNAARQKRISGAQITQLSDAFDNLPIWFDSPLPPARRRDIIRLAERHRLTAYDAAYLELAVRLALPLASLDNDLRAAARADGVGLLI